MAATSISVSWMWTNCAGAEPTDISLRWSPAENLFSVKIVNSWPPNYEITGLEPTTNYSIMVTFGDVCGSNSAETFAATRPNESEYRCQLCENPVAKTCILLGLETWY